MQPAKSSNTGLLLPLVNSFYSNEVLKVQCTQSEAIDHILLCLRITELALEAFVNRQMHLFDPLVGENACQIRAIKLAKMADKENDNPLLTNHVKMMLETVRKIAYFLNGVRNNETSKASLQEHIRSLGCDPSLKRLLVDSQLKTNPYLTDDLQFLAYSFLLTLTRDEKDRTLTNERQIGSLTTMNDSQLFLKIVLHSKTALAKLSLEHLRKKIIGEKGLGNKEEMALLREMALSIQRAGGNIDASPCFFNLLAIMKRIMTDQMIVVLKVQREGQSTLSCALKGQQDHFKRLSCEEIDREIAKETPVILIEGVCKGENAQNPLLLDQLLKEDDRMDVFPHSKLCYIVLANAAAHPQYAGDSKHEKISFFNRSNSMLSMDMIELLDKVYQQTGHQEEKIPSVISQVVVIPRAAEEMSKPTTFLELAKAYVRLQNMKAIALREGFSEANPSMFQIKHIFCDIIKKGTDHG